MPYLAVKAEGRSIFWDFSTIESTEGIERLAGSA
jgi:hypothetical protein